MAQGNSFFSKLLVTTVHQFIRLPFAGLILLALATFFAGTYAYNNFKVNSERSSIISPDAPFRQHWDELQDTFPMYRQSIVILIEAQSAQDASDAAERLADALHNHDGMFKSIFAPAAEPFFQDHGLLYQSEEELEQTITDLAAAQPALASLSNDPSLRGLFDLLDTSLQAYQRGEDVSIKLVDLMNDISDVGDAVLDDREGALDWEESLGGGGDAYQVITLQINEDFSQVLSGGEAIRTIRNLAEELELTEANGISVSLTGSIPLANEEMQTVAESIGIAGFVSLILLTLILGIGVRSVRIILSIVVTLIVGVVWTMAWAMFAVGELNMISATFAVLIVGLGVDFAIHLSLRYHEAIERGLGNKASLEEAVGGVGGAIALASLTSAVGFLSFLPTQYKGIADLGLIAGGGMICTFLASITVLPVLLGIMGSRSGRLVGESFARNTEFFFHGVSRFAVLISVFSLVLGAGAIYVARHVSFDFSTLTLKGDNSQALQTLKRLQELGVSTDYAVFLLAQDTEEAEEIARKLGALDSVRDVELPQDYVPQDQEIKLELIGDIAFSYLPILDQSGAAAPPNAQERLESVQTLEARLLEVLENSRRNATDVLPASRRLAQVLGNLQAADTRDAKIEDFDKRLVGNIDEPLDFLRNALFVGEVSFEDLPAELRRRLVSPDGEVRVVGTPEYDITDFDTMKAFVADVRSEFPKATGRPVLEAGVGDLVVSSFRTAIIIALASISAILIFFVRNVFDTILIMTPLILAALLTAATGVIANIPFNQANIIVLPLIMGLGVDNGIHVLMRFREDGSIDQMVRSSTPRAVVLSTLTTIAAFGSLALSTHAGIQSMGLLLAIAMGFLLFCTIGVLPALLYTRIRVLDGTWRAPVQSENEMDKSDQTD